MARFAAIGLDHRHIYDLTQDLMEAGAECVGYNPDTTDARVLAGFRKRFPHVPAAETERLLEDRSIDLQFYRENTYGWAIQLHCPWPF